jgi:hypothetical protein
MQMLTKDEKKLLELHQTLKLQIELVPAGCWGTSLSKKLARSKWDKIKKEVNENANYTCEICGGIGTRHPVECHEVWIYEEDTLTQRLGHFQSLCPLCHEVKHYGRTHSKGNEKRAFNRFVEVNKLDVKTAKKIIEVVFKEWGLRSNKQWEIDIDHLLELEYDIVYYRDFKKIQFKKTNLSPWENLVKKWMKGFA